MTLFKGDLIAGYYACVKLKEKWLKHVPVKQHLLACQRALSVESGTLTASMEIGNYFE